MQLWFVWCFKYTKIIPASRVQIFKFSKLFILSFSWIWNDKNISSKAFSYFKISNLWLIQSIINPWWCWELAKALTPIFYFYSRASLETIISFWFSVSRIKIHRTVKLLKWRQTTRLFIYLLYTKTLFQSTLFLARTVNAVIESKDDCQPSMRKGTCDGSFQIR